MHVPRTRLVLTALTVLALLPLAAAPVLAGGPKTQHERILAHWTKERIAKAVPRDFVKAGGSIGLAPMKGNPNKKPPTPPPGGGGSVLGASWTKTGNVLARTGRVVFSMGGGDWICSGTVVDDNNRPGFSMVLTAGHCAIDETNGEFATNWMFIPAFDTFPTYTCSASAYGCWTAVGLAVHNQFATAGSFNNQAVSNDWALAIVGPGGKSGTTQLDTLLGSFPIGYNGVAPTTDDVALGNKLYAFGYPAAGKYHGSDLVYCAGNVTQDSRSANLTWGMACDMTGGSSGGPWLSAFDESTQLGTLSSVNSYGYGNRAVMYGPKFNSRTQATFNLARTSTTNVKATGG
jgi:V8-like Glu-specific endopeptidase